MDTAAGGTSWRSLESAVHAEGLALAMRAKMALLELGKKADCGRGGTGVG
jgi:hypothetical protein